MAIIHAPTRYLRFNRILPSATSLIFFTRSAATKTKKSEERNHPNQHAEIHDPTRWKRLWLGTFDTAEEAATEYDRATVKLKGLNAIINFPVAHEATAQSPPLALDNLRSDGGASYSNLVASPRSVLAYECDSTPFDGFRYLDFDAFGFHTRTANRGRDATPPPLSRAQ